MKHLRTCTLLLLTTLMAGGLLFTQPTPALAQETIDGSQPTRSVSVNGSGQVDAEPDVAVVTLGVETEAEAADEALSQNSEQMQALVTALTEAGIAEEDIQTQTVRLQPRYENTAPTPQSAGGETPQVTGYIATNLVEVRIMETANVGTVLDAAIAAGGNRIETIRFTISDQSELLQQAREAAWADAEQKAQQFAELAGAELGDVLTISSFEQPFQPVPQLATASAAVDAVPIQPGTQTVQVQIQVTWRLQ